MKELILNHAPGLKVRNLSLYLLEAQMPDNFSKLSYRRIYKAVIKLYLKTYFQQYKENLLDFRVLGNFEGFRHIYKVLKEFFYSTTNNIYMSEIFIMYEISKNF